MEVLHTYNGCYPFGKRKDSNSTYVQLIKENLTEEDIHLYKQMTKIYKNLNNPHFMRLNKMLRQDDKLYFIYEYEEISITAYVEAIRKSFEGSFTKERYKCLLIEFKRNIDIIIDVLIKQQIKTDVLLSSLACVKKQGQDDGFMLKVFVDMEAEYLSLIDHNYRPKDSKKKDRSSLNQEFLFQFYQAERKRLMLDFEELVENIFGSVHDASDKKQFPNFTIQGTKLVFVHSEEKLRDNSIQNVGEYKKNENKDKLGNRSMDSDKRPGDSNQMVSKQLLTKQRPPKPSNREVEQPQNKKVHPQTPIIDFDQSFEPEFRPEQFTKEKTYIYEEGDYLDSLEEEIYKLHEEKKGNEDNKINTSNDDKRFNLNSFNSSTEEKKFQEKKFSLDRERNKESKNSSPMAQYSDKSGQQEMVKQKDQISQGSTQSNPNNASGNRSKDNTSNSDSSENKQKKTHKMNKYKMKIITSHQIQIEGGEEPKIEQIEKEIMEGIRTGKININQLNNKQKFTIVQKHEGEGKKVPEMIKSDHREGRNSFDGEKMINSDHKPAEELKQPFVKTKEIPLNKMKNVHEIIQKLGIKPKNCKEEQEQLPRIQPKKQISYLQSATTPKPEKVQMTEKPERNTYPEKPAFKDPESPTKYEHRPSNIDQKPEAVDPNAKGEKVEKYFTKIQEARSKAEQILREYARKKN